MKKLTIMLLTFCYSICTTYATVFPLSTNAETDKNHIKIVVGFYKNAKCSGQPLAQRTMYLQNCFSWTRAYNEGERDNSANNFQCYKNKVCYTQYPLTKNCSEQQPGLTRNKQLSTQCQQEIGTGKKMWSKILSGTESCPKSPSNFQCPE
jgi:hypothetical protein